jgi:hypothetical protein
MNVATGQMAPARVPGNGPGKTGQVVIWRDGAARQFEYRWGLRPSEPAAGRGACCAPKAAQSTIPA